MLKLIQLVSGVARGSAARGGSRNCRPQMQWCTQDVAEGGGNITEPTNFCGFRIKKHSF